MSTMELPGIDMQTMLQPLLEQHNAHAKAINEIDERLNPDAFGRKKILDSVREKHAPTVGKVLPQVEHFLNSLEDHEQKVAVVSALQQLVRKDENSSAVDAYVNSHKVEIEKLPDEQVTALREQRKDLVNTATLIKQLVERTHAETGESLKEYKQLRGSAGTGGATTTRGTRLRGDWNFSVDGEPVGSSLTDVGRKTGTSVYSEGGIKDAIMAAVPDFDFGNPPSRVEFSIAGKHVVGIQKEVPASADEDDILDESDEDDFPPDPFAEEV